MKSFCKFAKYFTWSELRLHNVNGIFVIAVIAQKSSLDMVQIVHYKPKSNTIRHPWATFWQMDSFQGLQKEEIMKKYEI